MNLTLETLLAALPHLAPERAAQFNEPLNEAMAEFGIDTPARVAMFLAQCAHESAHFSRLTESFNYSAGRLLEIFPKYFSPTEAWEYARSPQRIAARVYANRMGNGNEASRDGWIFAGRGLLHLSGRRNYKECGIALGVDLIDNPGAVCAPDLACRSAGWFWKVNDLNESADKGDVVRATRKINGGTNGLSDRQRLFDIASQVEYA